MLKGVLHAHSTYSDGERSLAELRSLFLAEGCRFVAMSDHADAFSAATVRDYIAECDSLSDADFLFIPSLEFGCERRMHILGYGVTTLVDSTDPQQVLLHIERSGGVGVIAHPQDAAFPWIESFYTLPAGIEVWNTKYDGQYAPRGRTFKLLQSLQARRADMRAFYGQDYHWRNQFRQLFTVVHIDALNAEEILSALRSGAYHAVKGDIELPSSGALGAERMLDFERVNSRSSGVRRWISRANTLRRQLGIGVPRPIKAQLRRFF
jgi:hypothetical protein